MQSRTTAREYDHAPVPAREPFRLERPANRRFDVIEGHHERGREAPVPPRAIQAPVDEPVRPFDRAAAPVARPAFAPSAAAAWSPAQATNPIAVEQYRRMASLLLRAQATQGTRVIMVTSALPGEGKSLTAANLALTLCRSYRRRTLVIDADLRRPSLHTVFRVSGAHGLTDYLNARHEMDLPAIEVYPDLQIVPAGPPTSDPMGGLASARMQGVINAAADAFEWVVIDTPPVALLPDAHVLSAMVDGVVLVIEAAGTQFEDASRAVDTLGRDRILGVVLNRAADGLARIGQYAHYY